MATNISGLTSGQRPGNLVPYKEVYVLLLYWKDADDVFYKQLHSLGLKFGSLYGYDVEEWPIDSEEPYRKLNRKLFQFLGHDKEDTLLILYYGGHGSINQDRHHVWLCHDPNVDVDNPSINWSSLQQLFLNDCKSHVLFLLDCCRAAASVQDSAGSSVVELITAAGFESVTPRRGQHTFTSNLILTLEDCRGLPVRTPDLMRKLTARLKHHWPTEVGNEKRVTPGHFIISNDVQATNIVIGKLGKPCMVPIQREPIQKLPPPIVIQHQEIQASSLSPTPKIETPTSEDLMLAATDSQDIDSSPALQTTSYFSPELRKSLVRRPPRASLASRAKPGIASGVELMYSHENTYEYSPIDEDHIRLIHLLPGSKGDPLICKISTRRLRDVENGAEPEYQAISHVWDVSPKRHKLQVVDRGDIYIGSHNHAALCRLRDENEITIFWTDDLCVNLHNPEEKGIQLSMLGDIFYNAWHVCVWLGDDADGSDTLGSFIPRLLDLKQIDKLVECDSKPEEWQNFAAMMMRPWFSRRWIVQELISAREATLYCGSKFAVAWPEFCDAVALFGSRFDEIRRLFKQSPQFDYNPENLVDVRALGAFSLVEASKNIFRQSASGELASRTVGLETLASYLPVQQTSDPRDTIYALLYLASDSSPSSFKVEYKKSCLQVFKEFVDFCVHESKSIDIICRPWAPESMQLNIRYSGIAAHPGIGGILNPEPAPSWIPKISNLPFGKRGRNHYGRINGDSLVGQPNRKFYNASKGTSGMVLFGEAEHKHSDDVNSEHENVEQPLPDGSMTVSGVQVAKIESLGPRAADGTILADWIQMGEWSEGDTFVPDYFWRTLVADRGPNGIPPPAWYHRACLYCLEQSGGGDITLAQLSLGNCPSMAIEFLNRVRNVIWNRRFLRTSDDPGEGLFGLAPPKAREGDTICILHGCSVPVVLRRHKRFAGAWELVGECFVYGMMEGEAMIIEGSYPTSTEEFELR